jgi:hypothetical protein
MSDSLDESLGTGRYAWLNQVTASENSVWEKFAEFTF